MDRDNLIEQLTAEAAYSRERYDLYKARMYAGRPASHTRLRELERACEASEQRLAFARSARTAGDSADD